MQFNPAVLQRPTTPTRAVPTAPLRAAAPSVSRRGESQASAEIRAYIAMRDMLIADAERNVTDMTLNRAFLANELVENCLKPARSPYQAQCLAESEAVGERKRCEAATRRIGQLRACGFFAA